MEFKYGDVYATTYWQEGIVTLDSGIEITATIETQTDDFETDKLISITIMDDDLPEGITEDDIILFIEQNL